MPREESRGAYPQRRQDDGKSGANSRLPFLGEGVFNLSDEQARDSGY